MLAFGLAGAYQEMGTAAGPFGGRPRARPRPDGRALDTLIAWRSRHRISASVSL
jgi:hypothetical protein